MEYVEERKKPTILVASGQEYMDTVIASFEEFNVIAKVDYREELQEAC